MRVRTISAVLLPLLCLAGPAAAQDRKPVIDQVMDASRQPTTTAPKGGVVVLKGRNLYKPPEKPTDPKKMRGFKPFKGITVTLDGKKCQVFASDWDFVTFQVPQDTKPGKRKRIVVRVDRGSAKATIEIMTPENYRKSAAGRREGAGELGGGKRVTAEQKALQAFKITKFVMVPGTAGFTFNVEGRARKIPDQLRVQIKLKHGTRVIKDRSVPIKDEKFRTTFGPYKERLLIGNYAVELVFSLAKQSRVLLRRWLRKLTPDERKLYRRIVRNEFTSVGGTGPQGQITPTDLSKQKAELQRHSKELATECKKLMEQVQEAYALGCRCFWRKKGSSGYDEEAYKKYLIKMKWAEDEDAAKKMVRDLRFATRRGHFDNQKFETWAKDTFIPALTAVNKKHVDFNKQYIAPPDGRAERLGHFLISNVLKLFHKWAGLLYNKSRIVMPREVSYVPFLTISAPRVSVKYFHAKRRELMRQVGLPAE